MTDADKKLFFKFAEDAVARQIGERRIEKYRSDFSSAHTMTGMSLTAMVKGMDGLREACSKINGDKQQYSPITKKDVKRQLGSLYNFVHEGERSVEYASKEVKLLIRHQIKAADKRLAKTVITREELRAMTRFGNTMDKAMLWLLFESGMRNGEFEQLKKSDITLIEEGLDVRVPAGKTGERKNTVVEAKQFVLDWLIEHPKKDEDAPLWISIDTKKPLTQGGIAKRIREVVERLNIYRKKKGIPPYTTPINPHNFRHSRATELAAESGMTEQILCIVFGWRIGSDMPRTYLHLNSEHAKRAVLKTYGKAKPEEETKVITDWTCPKCKQITPLAKNYCGTCGYSRDGKVLSKTVVLEDRIQTLETSQKKLLKDQEKLLRYIANMEKKELDRRKI